MLKPILIGITTITSINNGRTYLRYIIRFHDGIFLSNQPIERRYTTADGRPFPYTEGTISYPITQAFDKHFDKPGMVAPGKINSMIHVTE